MSLAASALLRNTLKEAPKALTRGFHAGKPAMGGGPPPGYHYDYLHGPNMYDITGMKNRKLWFAGIATFCVVGGIGIPAIAFNFQQAKTKA